MSSHKDQRAVLLLFTFEASASTGNVLRQNRHHEGILKNVIGKGSSEGRMDDYDG
jgi:hypothetical protein